MFFYGSSQGYPEDARNLARMHLRELVNKISVSQARTHGRTKDDATRAHLAECGIQAAKVLEAGYDLGAP